MVSYIPGRGPQNAENLRETFREGTSANIARLCRLKQHSHAQCFILTKVWRFVLLCSKRSKKYTIEYRIIHI